MRGGRESLKVAGRWHLLDVFVCSSLLYKGQAMGRSGLFRQGLQTVTWKISAGMDVRAGRLQLTTRVPACGGSRTSLERAPSPSPLLHPNHKE